MDPICSESSGDCSPPSPADSTSADSSPMQTASQTNLHPVMALEAVIEDDDSASDVSMPAETDDEDDEPTNPVALQSYAERPTSTHFTSSRHTHSEGSKKRKLSTSSEVPYSGQLQSETIYEDRKRRRSNSIIQAPRLSIPLDKSLLPSEIWHNVFTFCPPRVLGLLLRVNKTFHAYLDPAAMGSAMPLLQRSALKPLPPDTIWGASRRHYPLLGMQTMPAPLLGKSELHMWRIACGSFCQFCARKGEDKSLALIDQWHPGPGRNGVAPILSFGIRSCGGCLEQQLTKEVDLLLSSSVPSVLMAALPFIFLTNEMHVIPISTLQTGQQPTNTKITKHYYKYHIDEIKREFEDVKALGSATAEEWLKGLEGRGKERRDDAARWERWEAVGGISKMREMRTSEALKEKPSDNLTTTSVIPQINGGLPTLYNGINSLPQPLHVLTNTASYQSAAPPTTFGTNSPARFDSPSQAGFVAFPSRSHPQIKHERTKEEVAELKAARRAEIERRCLLLDPPLAAGVLAHMASFQAAIQIIQPLTDSAWEVLKPRLLSQREEAEQRENDRIAQTRVVQERCDERRYQDTQAKGDPKDLGDKEWDDIQAPLRLRTGGYADEIIRDGWGGGEKVSPESCPLFAAEVLIYVRKRFYAEVAKDEAAFRAAGTEPEMDPSNGPYTRRLTLENMKWIFDTKVKPHTEQYRKELFLCNACDYASKYYGFEGVIQHYAAKHTSALSAGSVVVHWKSEWPEYPPFNPDPIAATVNSYYPAAPSASVPFAGPGGQSMPQTYGYGGYQSAPLVGPVQASNIHVYQESPGHYYGHPNFGDQYSGLDNAPYPPPQPPQQPQPYPDSSQAYHASQYSMAPAAPIPHSYSSAPYDYNQQNFDGTYPLHPQVLYTSPHSRNTYPATVADVPEQQPAYTHPVAQYSTTYNQPASYGSNNFSTMPQRSREYISQLQELARYAREVWNSIGSLKEVPGSVKVYTIIHHLLVRFRASFQEDPPLSMLVEGLSNNKDMRPVRNVNGLLCKACKLGMAGSNSAPQKKHFSFPQLVNHFHLLHDQEAPQNAPGYQPGWKRDMVVLPDISKLALIVNAPGMDDKKLRIFTEAIPEILSTPESTVQGLHNGSSQHLGTTADDNEYAHLAPSQDNHEKYYTTIDSGKPSEVGSVAYDPGEYDPRHPAEPPQHRPSRQYEQQVDSRNTQVIYQHSQREDHLGRDDYEDYSGRLYIEEPPARARPYEDHDNTTIPHGRRVYIDQAVRYQDPGDFVEYRAKRDPQVLEYQDSGRVSSNYQLPINKSYQDSPIENPTTIRVAHTSRDHDQRQPSDPAGQQNRIFEVVAQISQRAQEARELLSTQNEAAEPGSEDGEVKVDSVLRKDIGRASPSGSASNAAERFLNEFRPGEVVNHATTHKSQDTVTESRRARDRPDSRQMYRRPKDMHQRMVETYDGDGHAERNNRYVNVVTHNEVNSAYAIPGHASVPTNSRDHGYDERYSSSAGEQVIHRDRSPELVDRRYKLNTVVYRDERQNSNGTRRTPSRYARYESVRLENDRARSRSPVYVKLGPQSGQYRERSPVAHPLRQEVMYRTRTQLEHADDTHFERPRRQEYVRIYPDEHRSREVQYAETIEYVRVSDPQGDYVLRRPVRRETGPVYANYEDDVYSRPPLYEGRAPTARNEPGYLEAEEYDPRHPAAPLIPVRYQ